MAGKPEHCTGCPLYEAPGPVWGVGSRHSKLFLLGEAPGGTEVITGVPFTGGSGRVLNRMLGQAGIDRKTTYITNVVKCRPAHRSHLGLKDRPPTDEEIRHCAHYLLAELEEVAPNLVLALGATALYVLRGRNDIGNRRGVPLATEGGQKYLATFHPAAIMRQQQLWPIPVIDMQRAKAEAETPALVRVPVCYNTKPDPLVDGLALLDRCRALGVCYADIETTGLDPHRDTVVCIGLTDRPQAAECYHWSLATQSLVRTILADPRIEKVGQNSESFDWWFLEEKGFEVVGRTFDTMLAMHLTNSDLPKDLGTLGGFYTDMEYWKDQSSKDLFLYNCKDVDGTARSAVALKQELRDLGMEDLYYGSVMPLQPVLRRMTRQGIRKNETLALAWTITMNRKARELESNLKEVLGHEFDLNSPKQLMDLLYNKLGLPVQYVRDRYRGERPTANADALDRLAEISNSPILQTIHQVRTLDKYRTTFVGVETDEKGFVHPRFGCAKASNGRLNSWDPNAQNIPQVLREIYVPDDEDCILLACDWGQIEWRIDMVLSGDPVGLQLMASGYDVHSSVTSEVHGISLDAVTPALRHETKFIVYGLGYGRGAKSISEKHNLPLYEVDTFIKKYMGRFREYAKYREDGVRLVDEQYFLRNPFGRRRWWFTRQPTEIYNFRASSTAADMMYIVLVSLERELRTISKDPRLSVRLSVHDEVVVNTPRQHAKRVAECVRETMSRRWPQITAASRRPELVELHYPGGWTCPSELHLGMNWQECKKGNAALEKEVFG
jgi:DNA polymerase-1